MNLPIGGEHAVEYPLEAQLLHRHSLVPWQQLPVVVQDFRHAGSLAAGVHVGEEVGSSERDEIL